MSHIRGWISRPTSDSRRQRCYACRSTTTWLWNSWSRNTASTYVLQRVPASPRCLSRQWGKLTTHDFNVITTLFEKLGLLWVVDQDFDGFLVAHILNPTPRSSYTIACCVSCAVSPVFRGDRFTLWHALSYRTYLFQFFSWDRSQSDDPRVLPLYMVPCHLGNWTKGRIILCALGTAPFVGRHAIRMDIRLDKKILFFYFHGEIGISGAD